VVDRPPGLVEFLLQSMKRGRQLRGFAVADSKGQYSARAMTQPARLRGRRGSSRVAVLTIEEAEFDAAAETLGGMVNLEGTPYFVGDAAKVAHDVVLRKAPDRGNHACNKCVKEFVEDFRPEFLLLVGTAGGVTGRDGVRVGDVVVADYVEYSEFSKLVKRQHLKRAMAYDHPSLYLRESIAHPLSKGDEWIARIKLKRPRAGRPKVLFGQIVAGEKLLGDPDSTYQKRVLKAFDKAIAVDMESWGVGRAVYETRFSVHYNLQYLVIRAISDPVDSQSNDAIRRKWRNYASAAASAFAMEVVQKILKEA